MLSRLAGLFLPLLLAACVSDGPAVPGPTRLAMTAQRLPLDPADPGRNTVGRLSYRGGLVLSAADPRFGGLSGLRWRDGRLHAVSDRGDFIVLEPREDKDRLVGVAGATLTRLRDTRGQPLAGKADAEALTGDGTGGWLVAFERDHRVWRYPDPDSPAVPTGIDPAALLGPLAGNQGVEAMAGGAEALLLCAERTATAGQPNCVLGPGTPKPAAVGIESPRRRAAYVPTDADRLDQASVIVLLRSYSQWEGAAAMIAIWRAGEGVTRLAALEPPLSVDNMEGIAVRHEGGRTYIYIVSDDNFSPLQQTLLMKFRLEPEPKP